MTYHQDFRADEHQSDTKRTHHSIQAIIKVILCEVTVAFKFGAKSFAQVRVLARSGSFTPKKTKYTSTLKFWVNCEAHTRAKSNVQGIRGKGK